MAMKYYRTNLDVLRLRLAKYGLKNRPCSWRLKTPKSAKWVSETPNFEKHLYASDFESFTACGKESNPWKLSAFSATDGKCECIKAAKTFFKGFEKYIHHQRQKHQNMKKKKRSVRRKRCTLAVVTRNQKFSPRRRPPSRGHRTAKI